MSRLLLVGLGRGETDPITIIKGGRKRYYGN